jgi:hypothetical protein
LDHWVAAVRAPEAIARKPVKVSWYRAHSSTDHSRFEIESPTTAAVAARDERHAARALRFANLPLVMSLESKASMRGRHASSIDAGGAP